jgi:hypothetical protein
VNSFVYVDSFSVNKLGNIYTKNNAYQLVNANIQLNLFALFFISKSNFNCPQKWQMSMQEDGVDVVNRAVMVYK